MGHLDSHLFDEELVLLGEDGAPFFDRTKDVAFHVNEKVWVNNHIHVLRPYNCDARYLTYSLNSVDYSTYITGSTRDKLTQEDMKTIAICLPSSREEQRRIVEFLDAETSRIDQLLALRLNQKTLIKERLVRRIQELAVGGADATRETGNKWIPQVPLGWTVLPLKRRWKIIDCKHRTPQYLDAGYPVVSPGDISEGRLDLSRCHRFVGLEDYEDLADDLRRPRRGDIVYSRNASIGIASYVDTNVPFTMGQDVCRITGGENQLYLTYVLNFLAKNELHSLQVGSTFSRVNISMLLDLSVPYPPVEQQQLLSREMDSAATNSNRLIAAVERQVGILEERRQALIAAAVTGQFDVSTASGRNTTQGV